MTRKTFTNPTIPCGRCGAPFRSKHPSQRYCSSSCRSRENNGGCISLHGAKPHNGEATEERILELRARLEAHLPLFPRRRWDRSI